MQQIFPAIVQKAKPAVVEILTYDQQNKLLKTGTGFFISPDGELLTNYHVISGGSSIMAKTPTGSMYFLKSVVAASETNDVATLQFFATDVPCLTLGSSANAVEGQRVLVIGNPEGLEGTVSDGIISAFRAGRTMIQITAPLSPGSSGSPVLDESGNVIGIATQVLKEGQNLNFAISAEMIRDAIAKSAVVSPTPLVAVTPTPSFTGNSAEDYYHRAVHELGNFDWRSAVTDLSEAIRLKPAWTEAYSHRGSAYHMLGQFDQAISDYTEVIRVHPDDFLTYSSRGDCYARLKQYRKAIADYTEAIRLVPPTATSQFYIVGNFYEGRVAAYDALGNHAQAAKDRKKAKELRGR